MAADLLFDLSDIDFDHVAVDADTVGRINPQCGAMRQVDHVIMLDTEAHVILGVKHVSEDEFWVPLHVPGRPLMPGVLMIEAAAQISSILYRYRGGEDRFVGFTRCDDTVFRGLVVPGDTLYLLSKEVRFNVRRFESRAQGVVNGKLVFETTIVGMVV